MACGKWCVMIACKRSLLDLIRNPLSSKQLTKLIVTAAKITLPRWWAILGRPPPPQPPARKPRLPMKEEPMADALRIDTIWARAPLPANQQQLGYVLINAQA